MPSLSKTALTVDDKGPRWGFYLMIAAIVAMIGLAIYCNMPQPDPATVIMEPVEEPIIVPPPDPNAYPSNADSLPTPVDPAPPTP